MYMESDMQLSLTLIESAQAFHWRFDGEKYIGHAGDNPALAYPRENGFELSSPLEDETFWRAYFDLDRDYEALRPICEQDKYLRDAYNELHGLHVLNQPIWDTVITFIISANNNVSRIRKLVNKLCDELGAHVSLDGCDDIAMFPTPERLAAADVQWLRDWGFGYRAPYLIKTAQMVRDGFDLNAARTLPYEQAHKKLLELSGVGPKVADCVLLFGCGHSQAFPVDVWMERVMLAYDPELKTRAQMKKAAQAIWGENAGLLQQYLFHAARMGTLKAEEE